MVYHNENINVIRYHLANSGKAFLLQKEEILTTILLAMNIDYKISYKNSEHRMLNIAKI